MRIRNALAPPVCPACLYKNAEGNVKFDNPLESATFSSTDMESCSIKSVDALTTVHFRSPKLAKATYHHSYFECQYTGNTLAECEVMENETKILSKCL